MFKIAKLTVNGLARCLVTTIARTPKLRIAAQEKDSKQNHKDIQKGQ
jgi:hypothetical protein